MYGQRRTNRFIKRRSWGKIRADIRAKFSQGDYDIRAEWLRPMPDEHWDTTDSSRMRWLLKHKRRGMSVTEREWQISMLRGDTTALERKYGLFLYRCPGCGQRLWTYGMHLYDCPVRKLYKAVR